MHGDERKEQGRTRTRPPRQALGGRPTAQLKTPAKQMSSVRPGERRVEQEDSPPADMPTTNETTLMVTDTRGRECPAGVSSIDVGLYETQKPVPALRDGQRRSVVDVVTGLGLPQVRNKKILFLPKLMAKTLVMDSICTTDQILTELDVYAYYLLKRIKSCSTQVTYNYFV